MLTQAHINSITTYNGLDLSHKQGEVVAALKSMQQATDQQIADYLGYPINRVTGRITELKNAGVVIEDHDTVGQFGKRVRVSRLKNNKQSLFE